MKNPPPGPARPPRVPAAPPEASADTAHCAAESWRLRPQQRPCRTWVPNPWVFPREIHDNTESVYRGVPWDNNGGKFWDKFNKNWIKIGIKMVDRWDNMI